MTQFFLQVFQKIDNLPLHAYIQSTDRFITNDKARLHRQGPCNANALTLSATEFMRIACRHLRLESDLLQKRRDRIPSVGRGKLRKWISNASPMISPQVMRGFSDP